MSLTDFVTRARRGASPALIYSLGHGGWLSRERPAPGPGRTIVPARALDVLRSKQPKVHAAYVAEMAKAGLKVEDLPRLACDCSGFLCWALGVPRDGAPLDGGWINTDAMHADALGRRRLFQPLDRAVPGALLVHPRPGGDSEAPGHVGIVTEVDATGRATRMLHCAPENYLRPPVGGAPRCAIVETDTAYFDAHPTTRLIVWKAYA
jgi:hypothetical protein